MQNPYQTLGVAAEASDQEIKTAYRKLAMKYHPDRNADPAAVDMFKNISAAYEILSDPHKRAQHDRGGRTSSFHSGLDPFADIFDHLFRHAARQHDRTPVSHLEVALTIDLRTAMLGGKAQVDVRLPQPCEDCSGSGAVDGVMTECVHCHGRGTVTSQLLGIGLRQTCSHCNGSGRVPQQSCKTCGGQGQVLKNKHWTVNIPAGIQTGNRLRIAGEGLGPVGQRGDLYFNITVEDHPVFVRDQEDLHVSIPVRATTAALGGVIDVPGLNGLVSVKIPPGTQHGRVIVQRGMGGLTSKGKKGDMHVHVNIEVPVKLNKEQKHLLEEFDRSLLNTKNSPQVQSFWQRIKGMFQGS